MKNEQKSSPYPLRPSHNPSRKGDYVPGRAVGRVIRV